jgi:broad specificity phosphatase PhoE
MKLVLIRHGESDANVSGVLSSQSTDPYSLTKKGERQVIDVAKKLRGKIDTLYVSPFLRTEQTAQVLLNNIKAKPKKIIEQRIKEIDYGKYSGQKNNNDLDRIRRAQVSGDYLIKFGGNGENKKEILERVYDFLIEVISKNNYTSTIVVVTHGSIVGWIERAIADATNSESAHLHTANGGIKRVNLRKRDILALKKLRNDLDIWNTKTKKPIHV